MGGSTPKRLKFLEESNTQDQLEDRLSNLPQMLITHIVSFLPTKDAVATSGLSTFWKDQWTSSPNLDFDDNLPMPVERMSFMNFVHRVLDNHKAPQICRFRLNCRRLNIDNYLINTCVSYALSRHVQKFELFVRPMLNPGPLPSEIFTSGTLSELRLGSGFVVNIPSLVRLPNLRSIYLQLIEFMDNESPKRLFSSCPVLEHLTLYGCELGGGQLLNISSPTLKWLALQGGGCFAIELNTPHLEHLEYAGQITEGFLSKNREFLGKVLLHEYFHYASETVEALARGNLNIQSLYLSGEVLKSLLMSRDQFKFSNLRTLVVGYNNDGAWEALPKLLENSPNLKNLELNNGLFGKDRVGRGFRWVPPEVVPACLLRHLEEITVHEFKGDNEELKMMEYLLMSGRVLRKCTIKSAMDAQGERKVRRKLLNYKFIVTLC